MRLEGVIFIGTLIGIGLGLLIYSYGKWKTREWFQFITRYNTSIDDDTDWWGYIIYKKYPLLALFLDIIKGIFVGNFIMFIVWVAIAWE